MKEFLASHDIKLKDLTSSMAGVAVITVATASLREQQLSRKELAAQSLAQKNRDNLGLVSHVRRNVKDGLMSQDEALAYCKRDDIHTHKECLGSADSQSSNKNLRGGGRKINSHKKISKDNQINPLFDRETEKWLADDLPSEGLMVDTSELNYTRPKSEMAGVAVSASPPVSSEFKNNEVWVLPALAPFIAGVTYMVLYGCFILIKNKNPRIKNFFATDTEKILENQDKIQEKLNEIYSEQREIKKKLRN
jgi:hypothetical protein